MGGSSIRFRISAAQEPPGYAVTENSDDRPCRQVLGDDDDGFEFADCDLDSGCVIRNELAMLQRRRTRNRQSILQVAEQRFWLIRANAGRVYSIENV